MKLAFGVVAVVALGLASSACGDEDINFAVKYAPGFSNAGNVVSIFGIFKDGRMSPDTWEELGPRFSSAFHSPLCEIAISSELRRSNLPLFTAVDDGAREEGITDPMLDRFAPAAAGTSILVITIAGHAPKAKPDALHAAGRAATRSQMGGMGRGGAVGRQNRYQGPSNGSPRKHGGNENDVYEISASLYSTAQHQSVAVVSMAYKGASEQEALGKFVAKLGASFPGATCTPWKPDALPTEDAIRHLPSPRAADLLARLGEGLAGPRVDRAFEGAGVDTGEEIAARAAGGVPGSFASAVLPPARRSYSERAESNCGRHRAIPRPPFRGTSLADRAA